MRRKNSLIDPMKDPRVKNMYHGINGPLKVTQKKPYVKYDSIFGDVIVAQDAHIMSPGFQKTKRRSVAPPKQTKGKRKIWDRIKNLFK